MDSIQLLAHRGLWQTPNEQNTLASFSDAFSNGFGIEFDVRDHKKNLLISHDTPRGDEIQFEKFLELYQDKGNDLPLAINIKSDGLLEVLKKQLHEFKISNYFIFDMSIPETVKYMRSELNIFVRCSEFENYPSLSSYGLWLDDFGNFAEFDAIFSECLQQNRAVSLVSPELHKREYKEKWQTWKSLLNKYKHNQSPIYLCTDFPLIAKQFFGENQE